MDNLVSLDIETCCNVEGCRDFGSSKCREDHSLSPWHGRITKIGVVSDKQRRTYNNVHDLDIGDSWLVGHNFKFDLLWLQVHGSDVSKVNWHCTQLMAYVLTEKIPDGWLADYERRRVEINGHANIHRKAGKHSLKTLAPYFLGVEAFWETEDHASEEYVLKDAEYTLRLAGVLEKKLKERGEWDFYLRLLEWTKMLLAAELRGIRIDLDELVKKERELLKEQELIKARLDEQWQEANGEYRNLQIEKLQLKYHEMAVNQGFSCLADSEKHRKLLDAQASKLVGGINYDSPAQVMWLLRDYLGYDCRLMEPKKDKKTGKIQYESTGVEVLERLTNEGKKDAKVLLDYRSVQKILTSYIPTYKAWAVDGVIHPVFNPDSTKTGRTSSERPNLQQVPPSLKSLFKARPGYKFIGYDAAQIEAKLIAVYTADPRLNEIIASGQSIHDYNTKLFFGLDESVDVKRDYPVHRQATKNISFALFYGAGANRLRITFAESGFHFTEAQCREIHARFKETYKTAIQFHRDITKFFESGEKMQNLLGRPVKIEDPDECYMTGFNSTIQGSGSDLNLEGADRAWKAMLDVGIDAHPLAFVHDYTKFEVREDQVEEANKIIIEKLTDFNLKTEHGPIALTVEGGISESWSK